MQRERQEASDDQTLTYRSQKPATTIDTCQLLMISGIGIQGSTLVLSPRLPSSLRNAITGRNPMARQLLLPKLPLSPPQQN